MTRIGIIADTHGLLRPEALEALAGVAHIVHAGDIGRAGIVEALARIAPVSAIRGNVDTQDWAMVYPETLSLSLFGRRIFLVHDRKDLAFDPAGHDLVVSGHSHKAGIEQVGGVLHINPGSAGPRRFRLPVTLALAQMGPSGAIEAGIHNLV